MTIKVNPNTCPKCGATIPTDAPQGLCPKCALLGAATPTDAGLTPTATAEIPSLERVAAAFPQLEILELLGRGGMGFVFKARQPNLDRFVALKLLPDKLARDPHFAERFSREARVLAKLNHPGIVSIYDFGQAGGFYFLLMEYVDGVNLHQAMRAGKFSPAAALAVVPKICEALQFAHEHGVLHRDIKPANILLDTKGRVKIADFGIAKLVGDEQPDFNLTATGATIGTPQYMSPEQLEQPGTVDHRADIYSLGVVFYEMLTGELPIGRFAPPSERTPLDPRVDEVVMRTLEKEREKRYQSAGEVKTRVEHLTQMHTEPGAAAPEFDPAQDFILCPPRLPRMAKAILVYSLLIAPILWLLSCFTFEPPPDNALVAFAQGLVDLIIVAGEFLVVIALAVGGWKLRGLLPAAVGWLRTSLWFHLGLIALGLAGQIWVAVLETELLPNAPTTPLRVSDGLLLAIALVSLAFEISALVWLRRHGALLRSICSSKTGATGPHGTLVLSRGANAHTWKTVRKWAAATVLIGAVGLVALGIFLNHTQRYFSAIAAPKSSETQSETAPINKTGEVGINFTFTAVEGREVDGKRWLAIDYLDEVQGDCQKSFPWESKIPGFKPEVRTSEFVKDPQTSFGIRHQRVEYLLPDSVSRAAIEDLRRSVEKALKQKTVRLKLGEQRLLFEFGSSSDTALKAWLKVMPPQSSP
ncbi:MAG: serine/threonine-protein kinase [Verrucomicrobiota bacterium]